MSGGGALAQLAAALCPRRTDAHVQLLQASVRRVLQRGMRVCEVCVGVRWLLCVWPSTLLCMLPSTLLCRCPQAAVYVALCTAVCVCPLTILYVCVCCVS
jgi:hypothetical protein